MRRQAAKASVGNGAGNRAQPIRYAPSYEPTGWFEAFIMSKQALTIAAVTVGAVVGGAIAYELPLLWFFFASSYANTSDPGPGISGVLWLAPFGAIVGAVIGGLLMQKRTKRLRDQAVAAAQYRPTPLIAHRIDHFDTQERMAGDDG